MALKLCIHLLVYILRTKTTMKTIKLQSIILLSINNIGTVNLNLFLLMLQDRARMNTKVSRKQILSVREKKYKNQKYEVKL